MLVPLILAQSIHRERFVLTSYSDHSQCASFLQTLSSNTFTPVDASAWSSQVTNRWPALPPTLQLADLLPQRLSNPRAADWAVCWTERYHFVGTSVTAGILLFVLLLHVCRTTTIVIKLPAWPRQSAASYSFLALQTSSRHYIDCLWLSGWKLGVFYAGHLQRVCS